MEFVREEGKEILHKRSIEPSASIAYNKQYQKHIMTFSVQKDTEKSNKAEGNTGKNIQTLREVKIVRVTFQANLFFLIQVKSNRKKHRVK